MPPRAPLEKQPPSPLPSSVRAGGLFQNLPLPPSQGPSSDNRPSSPHLLLYPPLGSFLLVGFRSFPNPAFSSSHQPTRFSFLHQISIERVVHVVSTSLSHGDPASAPMTPVTCCICLSLAWPGSGNSAGLASPGTCHHSISLLETCFPSPWLPRVSPL